MIHTLAYYEALNLAGALANIAAVPEQQYFVTGDDFRVPRDLTQIIGAACCSTNATAPTRAQVQSPTLRQVANLDVEPIVNAATWGSPPEGSLHPEVGVPLTADEALNFAVQGAADATPPIHYGVIWLADAPPQPVGGEIFTVQATAAVAQAVATWVNGALTFSTDLPVGRYAVVGMKARSTDGVVARLVFAEMQPRPGVLMANAAADLDPYWCRFGRMGVFGEFSSLQPPTLDVLGGAATAQVVLLDLIRTQ